MRRINFLFLLFLSLSRAFAGMDTAPLWYWSSGESDSQKIMKSTYTASAHYRTLKMLGNKKRYIVYTRVFICPSACSEELRKNPLRVDFQCMGPFEVATMTKDKRFLRAEFNEGKSVPGKTLLWMSTEVAKGIASGELTYVVTVNPTSNENAFVFKPLVSYVELYNRLFTFHYRFIQHKPKDKVVKFGVWKKNAFNQPIKGKYEVNFTMANCSDGCVVHAPTLPKGLVTNSDFYIENQF